jgi:hypothetical protein
MRYCILIFFCAINLTASAQFWQKKPKEPRTFLTEVPAYSFTGLTAKINTPAIANILLPQVRVSDMDEVEASMLKEAKHNMRFRIYNQASYNFSDLAKFYVKQNRFSEAKWYLLQSNNISRQQDDTKHTIANLVALANIKTEIGEYTLAKADLQEAHDMATAKGLLADLPEINKRISFLQNNKPSSIKVESRYAEAVEIANSKARIN